MLTAQEEIPALGHKPEAIPGKDATCTETGLTEGSKCSVCGEILKAQEEIPALGHKPEAIPGTDATCTETGLTEGSKCSVCGEIITAQTVMDALEHKPEAIPGKDATCTETGLTEGSKCSVCGEILKAQEEIPALGHKPEAIPGKDATCTEKGLTEGSKCSVCGEILTAQEETPIAEHQYSEWFSFYIEERELQTNTRCCIVCGIVEYQADGSEEIYTPEEFEEFLGTDGNGAPIHIHKNIEALSKLEPTCTMSGYEYRIICLDCGAIIHTQVIPALGHDWQDVETGHVCIHTRECARCGISQTTDTHNWEQKEYKAPTCTEDGYEIATCSVCGDVIEKNLTALGHDVFVVCNDETHTEKCMNCGEVYETGKHTIKTDAQTTRTESGNIATYTTVFSYVCTGLNGRCHYSKEITRSSINVSIDTDNGAPVEYSYEEIAPTCTEDGVFILKNKLTNEEISRSPIPAKGHTEVATDEVPASCGNSGLTAGTKCSVCGTTLTGRETISATGEHTYDDDGACTVCGQKKASEGLNYTLNSDKKSYSITGIGSCTDTDVIIPSTYEGLPVTSIGDYAFRDRTTITSITIPDSVTSISNYAFYYCSSLTSITIPDSVTSIGREAFYRCSSLTSITIPDSVTSIGNYAFEDCSSLTSITIPDSVTSIGSAAFSGCSKLTSITIPDSVTSIGDYAFSGCSSLTSITILDGVLSLGNYAFKDCTSLTSITIPDSVTSIGGFSGCTSLTSITIPDGVLSLGNYAFEGCSKLTSITIPDSVTSIGNYAFYKCSSLTSITIPDSVTSIGNHAFYNCSSLLNFTIPEGVTSIGRYAFYGCSKLTSITIPEGVTSINSQAFYKCSSLTDVYYTGTEEQWKAITIGSSNTPLTNATIHYEYGKEPEVTYSKGLAYTLNSDKKSYSITGIGSCTDTDVIIPSTYEGLPVTRIGDGAFLNCSSLVNVTIPDSVKNIGYGAFSSCSNLTNVNIGESSQLTSINEDAFLDCERLTSISIPAGVTSIGEEYAFRGCLSLANITVDENNSEYKSIDGNLYTKDGTTLIQYAVGKTDTAFTIPEGVTRIGRYAFADCSSLTSVTIADSVTKIVAFAFSGCSNLANISFGENSQLTSIDYEAFSRCYGLVSITIPSSVTTIEGYAFYCCSKLTSITIPDSVTSIGEWAFYGCSSLTSITIPDSVTSIGYSAFKDCTSLTSITIPDSVTSIGSDAFSGCTNLIQKENGVSYVDKWVIDCDTSVTSVTLRSDTVGISDKAFYNCTNLTSITIPEGVTSIGSDAFSGCFSLTDVYYTGTEEQWKAITIGSYNTPLTNATIHYSYVAE